MQMDETMAEKLETERQARLEMARQSLALLYVMRWARYCRSPHVLSATDKEKAFLDLLQRKKQWAKDGKMPIPPDREDPDAARVLVAALGNVENLDPTPQEAYLTVELAMRLWRFSAWKSLKGWAHMPWSFFKEGTHQQASKAECLGLLVYLSRTLARVPIRHDDL